MPPKKFKFRLEQMLEMKRRKEEEEQNKLIALRRELAEEIRLKAETEQKLVNVQLELKTKRLTGQVNIAELRFFPQHIKNLEAKIKYHELRIQEIEIKIEEQKQAVAKAMMERKAYEKLKENQKAAFDAEIEAAEALLLDELATIKFARDMRNKLAEEQQY